MDLDPSNKPLPTTPAVGCLHEADVLTEEQAEQLLSEAECVHLSEEGVRSIARRVVATCNDPLMQAIFQDSRLGGGARSTGWPASSAAARLRARLGISEVWVGFKLRVCSIARRIAVACCGALRQAASWHPRRRQSAWAGADPTRKHAALRQAQSGLAALWAAYHRTRSIEARNRLVELYVPLVHKLAEILARRLWPRVPADELASAGYEGLIEAVMSFDPSRNVKFETYCRQRILGAIRDWQREIDPLGRSGRNFERSMNLENERFQAKSRRMPTAVELARRMDMSLADFMRMRRTVAASDNAPVEPASDCNDGSRAEALGLMGPNLRSTHQTEREVIREYVTRGLREQDRLILTLYYYEKLSMAAIGAVLGVSESRVCHRHAQIVRGLRQQFASTAADNAA